MMQPRNFENRNEKIKFLSALRTGQTSISDIMPKKIEVWLFDGSNYFQMPDGKTITQDEYFSKVIKLGFKETDIIKLPDGKKVCFIQQG